MAIALLAKLRSLHTAAIKYLYIVLTLPRIIAISSHTYVSRTSGTCLNLSFSGLLTYLFYIMQVLYFASWGLYYIVLYIILHYITLYYITVYYIIYIILRGFFYFTSWGVTRVNLTYMLENMAATEK